MDPLTESYPWYTPYQFAGNTPIWSVDMDGLEEAFATDHFDEIDGQFKRKFTLNPDSEVRKRDIGMIQFKYSDGTESPIQHAEGDDLERILELRDTKRDYDAGLSTTYSESIRIILGAPTSAEETRPEVLSTNVTPAKGNAVSRPFKPVVYNGHKIIPGATVNANGLPFAFGDSEGALPPLGSPADQMIQQLAKAVAANRSISRLILEGSIGQRQPGLKPLEYIRLQQSMQHGFENIKQRLRQYGVPSRIQIDASGENVRVTSNTSHDWLMRIE